MITLSEDGIYLLDGKTIVPADGADEVLAARGIRTDKAEAKKGTIAYSVLESHNTSGNMQQLKLRFDALASHDITYVGIIQTARASGMESFPLPYVLTNCHNTLCAVGGTINEDDHLFGLSAAKKYGGIYVPPHMAVIHQYMRECMAGCGRMILGSDSHTRYGAIGTLGVGEGGGELVKQLLRDTYDIAYPEVIAIYLDGSPLPGVGPQDVALDIIRAVYARGYVKNKIMEFVGPGVASIPMDYRNGIDVMTTETTCLSSIWRTDEDTRAYLTEHLRPEAYRQLDPADVAWYDGCVYVDLSKVRPMIALPFHPSNAYTIDELKENLTDILHDVEVEAERVSKGRAAFTLLDKVKDNELYVQQAVIAGCAGGTFSNIIEAVNVLKGKSCGNDEFSLAVYPSSQPVFCDLVSKGAVTDLLNSGAIVRTAFCGPCFGAGDTPCNNALSIRHTTRNFPNREGSKPGDGQMAAVALMDARSIAATAINGGKLTSALEIDGWGDIPPYHFDDTPYKNRVYVGTGHPEPETELVLGPNIKDWPAMSPLSDNILLRVCAKILDDVTTTDELIPSGETSSYRSNPLGLAEFTLSRRDPEYVGRCKDVYAIEKARLDGLSPAQAEPQLDGVFEKIRAIPGNEDVKDTEIEIGSVLYANRPGDGSAREQAASCQRVLGGLANICQDYATKRYRSNVINWGMVPFCLKGAPDDIEVGSWIYVPDIRRAIGDHPQEIKAYVVGDGIKEISLTVGEMTDEEKNIVMDGCLINYNRNRSRSS